MKAKILSPNLETKRIMQNNLSTRIDGTIEGYASLFDVVDMGDDAVKKGAFKASLERRGQENVRMLFQHNPDQPIGRWLSIEEDHIGLKVRGVINQDVSMGAEVLSLLRSKAVDGLSIGFKTKRASHQKGTNGRSVRHLYEVDLWEISIVTFPMLPGACVQSVKSRSDNIRFHALPSARKLEHWLRREAGLSRSAAKTLLAKGYGALNTAIGRDAKAEEPLAKTIMRATKLLSQG